MKKSRIDTVKNLLVNDMEKYVELILREYGEYISSPIKGALQEIRDYNDKIVLRDTGTISMFATKSEVIMPKGAYKIFKYMRLIPGYGIDRNHKVYNDGEIVNNNTYFDYIKHVFVSGMDVEDFFRDTLLHETMHFCGSGGVDAIREGITELKTRELAQKYGLKASRCGYPKEVEVVSKIQEIIGENIVNQIAFAESNRQIDIILQENCGNDVSKLYFEISRLMNKEHRKKYDHSKFSGILGPIKKAKAYSDIDYSEVYEKLEELKKINIKKTNIVNIREKLGESSKTHFVGDIETSFTSKIKRDQISIEETER